MEGLTYAGCQGLEILHPDGHRYTHGIQQDYKEKLKVLEEELNTEVAVHGAWVEHKDLLVAWHYRYVRVRNKNGAMAYQLGNTCSRTITEVKQR